MNKIVYSPPIYILFSSFLLLTTYLYAQAGWSVDRRLIYRPGDSYNPEAACSGDTIHLVWWESYAYDEVFYKRSTDAGFTWEDDVMLSVEDTWWSVFPQVAVSGNDVHVIWGDHGFGLFYRRSTDGGTTWGNIDSLIPGIGYSSIQAFGDTVYVCGAGGSQADLPFTKSIDGGNNWAPIVNITTAGASPTLRVISNNVSNIIISYRGATDGEVYSVHTYNSGETWSDSQMVSDDDGIASQRPAMDTDNNDGIHITWYDYKYSPYPWTGDILYRASKDSGNTWFDIDSLTISHRAVVSDILAEDNNLHLVWEDDRYDFNDNFEIFYRMSADLGQTWGSEVRLTDTLNWSRMPSLACDGHYLHLFWSDERDDTSGHQGEIYYKRKDLLVPIYEENRLTLLGKSKFEACPNPFKEEIRIKPMNHDTRYKIENVSIKIFDILGKEVIAYEVKEKLGGLKISTRNLPSGVYFIKIKVCSDIVLKKVIKVE
jgi:hypothetical protein